MAIWHGVVVEAIKADDRGMVAIAKDAKVRLSNLSRYVTTGKGLSAYALEGLATTLGLGLAPAHSRECVPVERAHSRECVVTRPETPSELPKATHSRECARLPAIPQPRGNRELSPAEILKRKRLGMAGS